MNNTYKIILIFLIIIFSYFSVNAEFLICDSGNINISGTNVSNICNDGFKNDSFSGELIFTGSYIDYSIGYWGNNNTNIINSFYENNYIIGLFDNNKSTIITKINPEYSNSIGFIGNKYDSLISINLNENLSVGFFDNHLSTHLQKNNPSFLNYVGFIGNVDIDTYINLNNGLINNTGNLLESGSIDITDNVNEIYANDFYENLFKKYTQDRYKVLGYSDSDYDEFINNLVFLISDSNNDNTLKISSEKIKIINENIGKNNFSEKILLLLGNLKEINKGFKKYNSENMKFYLIYYYSNY